MDRKLSRHGFSLSSTQSQSFSRKLKKTASFVLASFRLSTYPEGTPRPSLAAPLLTAFLSFLRECFFSERQHWRMCGSVHVALKQRPFGVEGLLFCVSASGWEFWAVLYRLP